MSNSSDVFSSSPRVALITGGSRGIGAAIVKAFADAGYSIAFTYRANREAAEVVMRDVERAGQRVLAVAADVSREDDVLRLFEEVDRALGPIAVLVNNAGVTGGLGVVEEVSWERLASVFHTNVFGAFLCAREAVARMKRAGGGAIINVSSQAAQFGGKDLAHYAASKAALNSFTLGFAREVAPFGIRVNAVSPAVIDTDQHLGVDALRRKALLESIPMGRMGRPEEVAQVVAWLASDAASYVTGAIVPVTGGR